MQQPCNTKRGQYQKFIDRKAACLNAHLRWTKEMKCDGIFQLDAISGIRKEKVFTQRYSALHSPISTWRIGSWPTCTQSIPHSSLQQKLCCTISIPEWYNCKKLISLFTPASVVVLVYKTHLHYICYALRAVCSA